MARTAVPQFDLYGYDAEKRQQFPLLCGVDEAGRGPLAGDVYAAAVILSLEHLPEGLNDSKKLSEKKRELLFPQIQEQAIAYCIATASVAEIEAYNILGATMLAMQRAVAGLSVQPNHVLIDGNRMPELSVSAETVVKGDAHSATIAAASILAKTYRDDYMNRLHEEYPVYDWKGNKGYPTKKHRAAIAAYGTTPYHRMSFNLLGDGQLSLDF